MYLMYMPSLDRYVYWETKRYESNLLKNEIEGAKWLRFHLLVRDFYLFYCIKYGNRVFYKNGIQKKSETDAASESGSSSAVRCWRRDDGAERRWKDGCTGVPIVDANMRELKLTGWMSNRGRQIVASYLVNELQVRPTEVHYFT